MFQTLLEVTMRHELALRRRISQERDRERAEELRREADMVHRVSSCKSWRIFSFLSLNSLFHTSSLSQEWVQMNEENHPPTMAVVIVMVITISVAIGLS